MAYFLFDYPARDESVTIFECQFAGRKCGLAHFLEEYKENQSLLFFYDRSVETGNIAKEKGYKKIIEEAIRRCSGTLIALENPTDKIALKCYNDLGFKVKKRKDNTITLTRKGTKK